MEFLKDVTNPFSLTLGIVFVLYLALKSILAYLSKGNKKVIELKDGKIGEQAKRIKHLESQKKKLEKLIGK